MMRLVAVPGNSCLVVNSALDNLLVSGSEIFIIIAFSIKRCANVAPKLLFGGGRPAQQLKRCLCRPL